LAAIFAAVLGVRKEGVVPAGGERVALVILLVAGVLAEQAGAAAPGAAPDLTADAAAQTDLIVELERVDDQRSDPQTERLSMSSSPQVD
jgi:hypothetical protein